jgi:hypothetical protein
MDLLAPGHLVKDPTKHHNVLHKTLKKQLDKFPPQHTTTLTHVAHNIRLEQVQKPHRNMEYVFHTIFVSNTEVAT